jgi:hypothetical protein
LNADNVQEAFEAAMRGRLYRDWGLTNIGVWLRSGYDEMVMEKLAYNDMLLLADSVPSIREFWGKSISTSASDGDGIA